MIEPSQNASEHNNLGASIRRHVRRNRNLFSGNSHQRSHALAANGTHSNQQVEPREQDQLLEEGKYRFQHFYIW